MTERRLDECPECPLLDDRVPLRLSYAMIVDDREPLRLSYAMIDRVVARDGQPPLWDVCARKHVHKFDTTTPAQARGQNAHVGVQPMSVHGPACQIPMSVHESIHKLIRYHGCRTVGS